MPANTNEQAEWHDLLLSAARLQREVPGAVLVGGTAVALLARHRYSSDADHVVTDLKARYGQVLRPPESLEGWSTARTSRPPVTILGSLDGQLASMRQLRRPAPLETQVVEYAHPAHPLPTANSCASRRTGCWVATTIGTTRISWTWRARCPM